MPTLNFGPQLLSALRFADLIDVVLVAALLFGLFSWLRQSTSKVASRRLAVAALLFGAIYLLANSFELFLVERVLRGLFLVSLVAVVVVFQAEIRRMLTHIGSFNPFAPPVSVDESVLDQLVEASAQLAEAEVGALIALKGKEPWEDLIQGGVPLGGLVSQPLLYSLFDPETSGHDGAVLIEGRRVTCFAAHLPLATDPPAESRFGGTRHAAALGLSEHCDALVIAVSEERGVISVAEDGKLDELASAGDLKGRLERFWQRHHAQAERQRWQRWLPRLQNMSLSFVFAAVLWLFFAYSPNTVTRTLTVPVEFLNVPADWELAEVSPQTVQATLVGSERAFERLRADTLAVSFDLSAPREGLQRLFIGEDRLELPPSVRLDSLDPQRVRVEAQRLVRAELPVEVPTLGSPPEPLRVASLRTEPATLTLLVPEAERPQRVLTEPLDLRGVRGETTTSRQLALPPRWRLSEEERSSVEVTLEVR